MSNLAAVKISSSAGFQHTLQRVSSFCHPSASSSALRHPSHASSPTCVITLLVTADVPTASILSSGRQQVPNSAVSHSPTTRLCSKLSFVEVGSSTGPVQATPVRTVSAGQALFPTIPHQLGRGSSGVSVASSRSRRSTLGDRPQGPPSGVGVARGSMVRGRSGKSQVRACRARCRAVTHFSFEQRFLLLICQTEGWPICINANVKKDWFLDHIISLGGQLCQWQFDVFELFDCSVM